MTKHRTEEGHARKVLGQLLRTPKSRAGLIAAVKNRVISKNFVYGWLTDQCRTGKVTVLKTGQTLMYQATSWVPAEKPVEGFYPAWLEPRSIPLSASRRVFLDGREVNADDPQREEQEEEA